MLLNIQNLSIQVQTQTTNKTLVRKVNLAIEQEKIVALVGGSGSGKTTTGLAILRLLPPELKIREGKIFLLGNDLINYSQDQMRNVRGKDISMIFQEPLYAFNPVFRIGYQIREMLICHTDLSEKKRAERILELLSLVELPDPRRVANNYPHQLSGGMRQRAMIAMALAANPKLIIADEPTSNIDVTLQARILDLFLKLREELKLSILLITHDLGVVRHLSDEVAIMYQGEIIEFGSTKDILNQPKHEYTQKLMETINV